MTTSKTNKGYKAAKLTCLVNVPESVSFIFNFLSRLTSSSNCFLLRLLRPWRSSPIEKPNHRLVTVNDLFTWWNFLLKVYFLSPKWYVIFSISSRFQIDTWLEDATNFTPNYNNGLKQLPNSYFCFLYVYHSLLHMTDIFSITNFVRKPILDIKKKTMLR